MSSNFRIRKLTKIGLACASKELLETILIMTLHHVAIPEASELDGYKS